MKTVLITGANKGIGFETARQLAQFNKIYYRVDYTYDESGNWVEKNVYKLRKDGDKAVNEKLFQTVSRKIDYKRINSKS
jgi:NAD(P)-dependent dehydrogenase (short-subunit alcohol dehydrogenase family)